MVVEVQATFYTPLMADLVLNISYDEPPPRKSSIKKPPTEKSSALGKRKLPEGGLKDGPVVTKRRITETTYNARGSLAAAPSKKPPRNMVSSLFTSNPTLANLSIKDVPERTNLRPSNAPVANSSTFEGLGLNHLLINHLRSKMSIQNPTSMQMASLPYLLKPYDDKDVQRDIFLQSQTGSGKTLAFLLPIIQDLLPLSSHSYIDRSVGTLAVIIAPTRELAKQISDVLELLLKLRLRDTEEVSQDPSEPRLTRWLVSGLLTGGATRTHEKARLRKGLPILVATPGRLLDHLQNSTAFDVGKCRWLVLDEADRLMELGFEETIRDILKGVEGRRNLSMKAAEEGQGMGVGGWEWRERRTILCSATMREDVQKLAGTVLRQPVIIKGTDEGRISDVPNRSGDAEQDQKFTPPSQLAQNYIVTPLKLRLVTLVALLRLLLNEKSNDRKGRGTQIIVFLSCTDSVDFHWNLLGRASMNPNEDGDKVEEGVVVHSPLLPGAALYRLHGSLPLSERLASLQGFSRTSGKKKGESDKEGESTSSILLCTSVASRGLDLPHVRAVVQYDLPTEGGATEYVHRVGRTARAGKGGEAWSFVCPSETDWVPWVQGRMSDQSSKDGGAGNLVAVENSTVLRKGFGGKGKEYEDRATEAQLAFERWVMHSTSTTELARSGFKSHLRAYATHPSDEKHIFHVRNLHSGHLAKAFALRDAPSNMTQKKARQTDSKGRSRKSRKANGGAAVDLDSSDEDDGVMTTEKRMKAVVRSQGRLSRKGGVMMSSGASEFQIASSDVLNSLRQ